MGLFSSIGKVLKGVGKVAGFIPGIGGTISKVTGTLGGLLDHKQPMAKPMVPSPNIARGAAVVYGRGGLWGPRVLRMSPTMPGGAISTPRGMLPQTGGAAPPYQYGGASSAMRKVRRKRKATRTTATKRRRSTARKLKFGSPAWRKKYLKKRR